MSVCNPSLTVTPVPRFIENCHWSDLTTRVFDILAEPQTEQRARELCGYIHILRTERDIGTYFMKAVANRIEMFIRSVKKTLDSVEEKSRGELPQLYKRHWSALMNTLQLFTEIGTLIEEEQVTKNLIAVSDEFWAQLIIVAEDSVLVPQMIETLSQKIFENKYEPRQVELIYEIVRSFDFMHSSEKLLGRFGFMFRRRIMEKSLRYYVKESLKRSSCEETILKVARWRQAIVETVAEMRAFGDPRRTLDKIISYGLSKLIFRKLAQEVSLEYESFKETHTSREMPTTFIASKGAFELLWGYEYLGDFELPAQLRQANMNCIYLKSICDETFGELIIQWETQAALQIRSAIMRFPTDPLQRITDSEAFIDFYCQSWNSHCRYVSFYQMLMTELTGSFEGPFFDRCLADWVDVVIAVERENIFYHLGALLRKYLMAQIDINPFHNQEDFAKLRMVLLSFEYARTSYAEAFREYSITHVMRPLVDEVAEKLQQEISPQDSSDLIMVWIARVDGTRKKLWFRKAFIQFNRRLLAAYFDFVSSKIGTFLREKDVQAINEMCSLVDAYATLEGGNLPEKIATLCQEYGREEIRKIDNEETQSRFPELVLSAIQQFDLLVNRISSKRVRAAVLDGFRSAIDQEARSKGSSALELLAKYFLPGVGMAVVAHRGTEECLGLATMCGHAFKYFSNLQEFPELFIESLTERAMNIPALSFKVEDVLFVLVCKFLDRNYAERYEDLCADLMESVKAMRWLPSASGFERTTAAISAEESEAGENEFAGETKGSIKGTEKEIELDDLLNEGLTFDGVEFNIRLFHAKLWPMKPLEPEFRPPPILSRIMNAFEEVYKVKEKFRALTWLPYYSRVAMLWRFTKDQRTYHVHCDSLAAAVMLLFEDHLELTFEYIQQNTGISCRRLEYLIDVFLKTNVLLRRENDQSQIFALNLDFQPPRQEFILSINYKDMEKESEAVPPLASKKAEKEIDSLWRCSAVMARVAKHASRISKKALFEQTIWELGDKGCRNPSQLQNAFDYLVKQSYIEYESTSKMFIYMS